MRKIKSESGRSLLETLSVLVVMAVLLLAGVAGYHFLIHQYKKQQTVKQISELAVRYKVRPVHADGEKVAIKTIYPEADRSDAYTMNTADEGRVSLNVQNTEAFSVVVNSILSDSCVSLLENGDYDAVLATNNYDPSEGNDYVAVGRKWLQDFDADTLTTEQKDELKKFLGNDTAITRENIINKICAGTTIGTAGLIFGDRCPKPGFSYWYSGKCWSCPRGQKEDGRGKCCHDVNACGYCETDDGYCLVEPRVCHKDQPVCDKDSGQCVECTRQQDCDDCKGTGLTCSQNHCCPVGQEWNGLACVCPEGQEMCGTQCCTNGCSEVDSSKCKKTCVGAGNVCQKCNDLKGEWELINSDEMKVCGTQCCTECNSAGTGCKKICDGTASEYPCKACDDTKGTWTKADDSNISGLGQCQKCEGGEIKTDKTCGCPAGKTPYTRSDNGETACCDNENQVLDDTKGMCCNKPKVPYSVKVGTEVQRGCCPANKPYYSTTLKKCVGCLVDTDCAGMQVCKADKTCGCPAGKIPYTRSDNGETACCDNEDQVLDDTKGMCCNKPKVPYSVKVGTEVQRGCCPANKPYYSTTLKKCVGCLVDTDCAGMQVCKADKTCGCPAGKIPYTRSDNGETACCDNEDQVLDDTKGMCCNKPSVPYSVKKGTEVQRGCCPETKPIWDGEKCVSKGASCPAGKTPYTRSDNGVVACCDNETQSLDDSKGMCCNKPSVPYSVKKGTEVQRGCCPETKPIWDGEKCSACPAGKTPYTRSDNGEIACCDNKDQVLDDTKGMCCNKPSVPYSVKKGTEVQRGCCPANKPIWDGENCVECMADTDCAGNQVCKADKTCGCPADKPYYSTTLKKCVECLVDNGKGTGACPTTVNPVCDNASASSTWTCGPCPEDQTWDETNKRCQQQACLSSGGVQMWEHGGMTLSNKGRHGEEYCCKDEIIRHNDCRDSSPLFIGYLADRETSNEYGGSSQNRFECCPKDRIQEYKHSDFPGQVLKQCCPEGYHGNPEIGAECCPQNQTWNSLSKKCEDALECTEGTRLYYRKASSSNGQGKIQGDCCEPDQKLVTENLANALFTGYKAGENTKYGCCPANRVNGNGCCKTGEQAVDNKCCKAEQIYTVNGVKKCCSGNIKSGYCMEKVSLGCTRICSKCRKKEDHCNNVKGPVSWSIPANVTVEVSLKPSMTHGSDTCHGDGAAYDETVVYVNFNGETKTYPKNSYPAIFTASTTSKTSLIVTHEDHTKDDDGAVLTCVNYTKKTKID